MLVVPFLLQIGVAIGVTSYLVNKSNQDTVDDASAHLRSEVTAQIEDGIKFYLATPLLVQQINLDALRLGQINPQNSLDLKRSFEQQLQQFQTVKQITFVDAQGRSLPIDRPSDRPSPLITHPKDWYQTAFHTRQPTWTPLQISTAPPTLSFATVQPVYQPSGTLIGALSVDFELLPISQCLKALKIGRSGQAFIMERSGQLVASSMAEQPFLPDGTRLRAALSRAPLMRATAEYLQQRFDNFNTIYSSYQLSFDFNQVTQRVQITPFSDRQGLDWLIVVVVPESDFTAQDNSNLQTAILSCLAALTLATAIGMTMARSITRSILRLNTAAKRFSQGQLGQSVAINRSDELGELATSFNNMATQLQTSRSLLETANQTLEQQVSDRTAELQQEISSTSAHRRGSARERSPNSCHCHGHS